jgi:hypothetical protein
VTSAKRYRHQCPHCETVRKCELFSVGPFQDEHRINCPKHGWVAAAYTKIAPFIYETARQRARREAN